MKNLILTISFLFILTNGICQNNLSSIKKKLYIEFVSKIGNEVLYADIDGKKDIKFKIDSITIYIPYNKKEENLKSVYIIQSDKKIFYENAHLIDIHFSFNNKKYILRPVVDIFYFTNSNNKYLFKYSSKKDKICVVKI